MLWNVHDQVCKVVVGSGFSKMKMIVGKLVYDAGDRFDVGRLDELVCHYEDIEASIMLGITNQMRTKFMWNEY